MSACQTLGIQVEKQYLHGALQACKYNLHSATWIPREALPKLSEGCCRQAARCPGAWQKERVGQKPHLPAPCQANAKAVLIRPSNLAGLNTHKPGHSPPPGGGRPNQAPPPTMKFQKFQGLKAWEGPVSFLGNFPAPEP